MQLRWRGRDVTGNHLMIFPRNGELFSISKPGFHVFTFSIVEDAMMAAAELWGYPEAAEALESGMELIRAEPRAIASLVWECRALIRGAGRDSENWIATGSHDRIVGQLLKILVHSGSIVRDIRHSRLRSLAIRRAREAVMDRQNLPFTVRRLCQETGVSARTLQYAFEEEFSMSPKSWLMARSLNQVRRELRKSPSRRTRIVDIANDCGFWHMGQFARDYRKMFGELPSETLNAR